MDMDNEQECDVLDRLAFNCTKLQDQLLRATNKIEQDELLNKYIASANEEFKTIPDFNDDLDWFNVSKPLTFSESLCGKIVVLDFFTYCCINCIHILPDLKKLENLYSIEDGLVIIGVHTAKFDNEKNSANILAAVQKYEISHPVVNDFRCSTWIELNIKCWPTLLILGPQGKPLFVLMGEGNFKILEQYVTSAINYYKLTKSLTSSSLPINPTTHLLLSSALKFPGKIACAPCDDGDIKTDIFAISDSGNHRILIINFLGDVLQKIGGKTNGFVDGDFQTAKFFAPQGLSFLNDHIIFVADTENHAIRKINLKSRLVETVVGNGHQGSDHIGGNIGKNQVLSSPWDVVCHKTRDMDMSFHMDENAVPEKDILFIAMAGTHQIWAVFLEDIIWWKFQKYPAQSCIAIAGNGHEENRNNSYPQNAAFAQPSGLAISKQHKNVFIADSESSCIRKIMLTDGKVMPVVGGDRNPLNLFAFGDEDGKQYAAKLQHPLGVAYNGVDKNVYVADTYNHKIKKIDIDNNVIESCSISDKDGSPYKFHEPSGLCLNSAGDLLYVADTNNHSIEVINLKTMAAFPLKLNFDVHNAALKKHDFSIELPALKIKSKGKIKFSALVKFKNIKITAGAPQKWMVYFPNELYFVDKQNGNINADSRIEIDISVPSHTTNGNIDIIKIFVKVNLCSGGACSQKVYLINIPVEFDETGLDCIIEDIIVYISENGMKI